MTRAKHVIRSVMRVQSCASAPLHVAGLSLLLVTGLPLAAAASGNASGHLMTSSGTYQFTPTICAIYREDGIDDIEIGGPGTGPDGESFYFELTSTGNELSLGFGADGPFASAERQFKAGRYVSREFTVEVTGRTVSVPSIFLVDEAGTTVDASATLTIDCGN